MLVTLASLLRIREDVRSAGLVFVMTAGNYDLVHGGHVRHFREARAQGDVLAVQLAADEVVHRLKGEGRPVLPFEERAVVLSALRDVDYVVADNPDDGLNVVRLLLPDVFVRGCDYAAEGAPEEPVMHELDGAMIYTGGEKRNTRDIVAQIRA